MLHIIAMGGGGFSVEPDNPALDGYILRQARSPRPKVCFLPTASDNADSYLLKFYQAFSQLACQPSHLSLFSLPTADLESFVLDKDVIYVGGGNTRSLLALWREWGLDRIFRVVNEAGVAILRRRNRGRGQRRGQLLVREVHHRLGARRAAGATGLGLLPGSFTPHYDGEPARRPTLHRLLAAGEILPGFAAAGGAAIHFVDGQFFSAVRSRPT